MSKYKICTCILLLFLALSLICNIKEYNSAMKYKSKMQNIDVMFISALKRLDSSIKTTYDSPKPAFNNIVSTSGEVFGLVSHTSYCKNNSELIGSIDNLNLLLMSYDINKNRIEDLALLKPYLKKLISNPNDANNAKELYKFVKVMEGK